MTRGLGEIEELFEEALDELDRLEGRRYADTAAIAQASADLRNTIRHIEEGNVYLTNDE